MQQQLSLLLLVVLTLSYAEVRLPPSILVGPEDKIYRSDDSVSLPCQAEGVPDVACKWLKNGRRVEENAPNIHIQGGNLTIDPAHALDEGYYQCVATNMYGKALSRVAEVKRALLDVDSTTVVKDFATSVGQPVKIICSGVRSYPKPIFSWHIVDSVTDDTPDPIRPNDRIQMGEDGTLYFSNALQSDAQGGKIYKCLVFNNYMDFTAGGSYSRIVVSAGSPSPIQPTLAYSTGDVTALHHGEQTMKCFFNGYTTPRVVSWTRADGIQLPPGRHTIKDDSTTLVITDIQWTDEATYICRASNGVGNNVEHRMVLNVESKPVFMRQNPNDPNSVELKPMNLNKTEKESASFFCKPHAVPNATIQWLLNGDPLSVNNPGPRKTITNEGTNLTIHNLCKTCPDGSSDLVVVQCNISNEHGYSYSQGYLNVLETTELTVVPVDVEMNAWEDVVIFECDAVTDPSTPLKIIWKHNDVQVDPSRPTYEINDHNLHVYPMEESDKEQRNLLEGTYACEASNGYGPVVRHSAMLTLPVIAPPTTPTVITGGLNILDYWWIFLIIIIIVLIILLCLCCYMCYQRNKGDEYLVDEKDRKQGFDPEKELKDSGFHDFQRPHFPVPNHFDPVDEEDVDVNSWARQVEAATFKGSRASLTSTIKMDTDDEQSLLEYGEPDTGKFNEDGSFIGQYQDTRNRRNDSTV